MTEYAVHMESFAVEVPDKLDYYDDLEEIIRLIKIDIKKRDHGFTYERTERLDNDPFPYHTHMKFE